METRKEIRCDTNIKTVSFVSTSFLSIVREISLYSKTGHCCPCMCRIKQLRNCSEVSVVTATLTDKVSVPKKKRCKVRYNRNTYRVKWIRKKNRDSVNSRIGCTSRWEGSYGVVIEQRSGEILCWKRTKWVHCSNDSDYLTRSYVCIEDYLII